jgi:ABC-type phosphate/phosphonate transport system substrate-binding protein
VATPGYGAPGCDGTSYRSAIVIRADESANALEDLRGRCCVVNEPDSNSGMNLFRAALAPLAGGTPFFQSVRRSGSHRASLERVAAGEADVTAIDCVTLAHLQRIDPPLTSRLKVVAWTPASPCLPYVTSCQTNRATLEVLRTALAAVLVDPALAPVREVLLLQGLDSNPDTTFGRVRELELEARHRGYPALL